MSYYDEHTLYTASWCGPCKWLKAELEKRGIQVVTKDIDERDASIEYEAIGAQYVPALYNHKEHELTENSSDILNKLIALSGYKEQIIDLQ